MRHEEVVWAILSLSLYCAAAAGSESAAPLAGPDATFLHEAARDGMFEIQASDLALQKSADPAIKSFAQLLSTQHRDTSKSGASSESRVNRGRRRLLGGLLSAYTTSLTPWAAAQPVDSDAEGAFIALSAILVGRKALDAQLGKRFHQALSAEDANFEGHLRSLLELINTGHIAPLDLQRTLDANHPDLAALPRKIVSAWYLDIVGSAAGAQCLAYEQALMSVVVADKLRPPTYAYGAYGTWEHKPV